MGRYLVTGGAGFIGGRIVERLVARGDEVVVLDDLSTAAAPVVADGATLVLADLAREQTYAERLDGTFDAVLHLGAQSSGEISHADPLRDFDVNARGTLLMLQWAEARGVPRFLHASSMAVYGPVQGPVSESAPARPQSYYGVSKVAAEAAVQFFGGRGLQTTIFRMFNVYGPGQNLANLRQGMLSIYLAYLLRGEPVLVKGALDRYRDFVHVDDVASAWLAALDADSDVGPRLYNLATGRRTTVAELLDRLGQAFGYAPHACPMTVAEGTPGDMHGSVGDVSRIGAELGWRPEMELDDGITGMVEWARGVAEATEGAEGQNR